MASDAPFFLSLSLSLLKPLTSELPCNSPYESLLELMHEMPRYRQRLSRGTEVCKEFEILRAELVSAKASTIAYSCLAFVTPHNVHPQAQMQKVLHDLSKAYGRVIAIERLPLTLSSELSESKM